MGPVAGLLRALAAPHLHRARRRAAAVRAPARARPRGRGAAGGYGGRRALACAPTRRRLARWSPPRGRLAAAHVPLVHADGRREQRAELCGPAVAAGVGAVVRIQGASPGRALACDDALARGRLGAETNGRSCQPLWRGFGLVRGRSVARSAIRAGRALLRFARALRPCRPTRWARCDSHRGSGQVRCCSSRCLPPIRPVRCVPAFLVRCSTSGPTTVASPRRVCSWLAPAVHGWSAAGRSARRRQRAARVGCAI